LAELCRADQERFLEAMEFIVKTSVELAYNFCQFALPALTVIDKDAWHIWVLHLLEIYDEGGVIAAVAAMQNAKEYADSISYAESLIDLEQVRRTMRPWTTSRTCTGQPIFPLSTKSANCLTRYPKSTSA
jgi:hypothetical protein